MTLAGIGAVGASPALASSAWWHVLSNARPTYLHDLGAHGADEVQNVTVTGETGGLFVLADMTPMVAVECESIEEACKQRFFSIGESASSIQKELEGGNMYGPHGVEVTGGCEEPAPPVSKCDYKLTFTGAHANQPVELINTQLNSFYEFISASVSATQVREGKAGKADGTIVATVLNIGNGNADECVEVGAGKGKFKDAGCTEELAPGAGAFEQEPVKIMDKLPAGLRAVSAECLGEKQGELRMDEIAPAHFLGEPGEAEGVECPLTGSVLPFGVIELRIGVIVDETGQEKTPASGVNEEEFNEVTVSGGGSVPKTVRRPVKYSSEEVPFGIDDYELAPENAGGGVDTQAGSHPFETTFTVDQNQIAESKAASGYSDANPAGLARDVNDNFPPGLIGNPLALERCTIGQFLALPNKCPAASVAGVAVTTIDEPAHDGILTFTTPVFNLEPSVGEPARFAFNTLANEDPVYLNTAVRSGGDYGITVEVHNIPQTIAFLSNVVTIWGVPGSSEHNATRDGCLQANLEDSNYPPCDQGSNESSPAPFFELPTACPAVPLQTSIEADSWEDPGKFQRVGPSNQSAGPGRMRSSPVRARDRRAPGCSRRLQRVGLDGQREGAPGREPEPERPR